jgi:2-oxoglutarate dehydrogenase E2 component (dihydrolipoamide succinyltransferase)
MVLSEHTAPHVSTIMEVDMTRVAAHRNANKETFSLEGVNLTFTAYFVTASVSALKAYPLVNSSWSEEGVRIYNAIHIGMATALGEEGLIVPVIKNADNLSLLGIARVVNDLASRARAHKLQPDEVRGGTFTITNHGLRVAFCRSSPQPQCAILGVGVIQNAHRHRRQNLGDVLAIRPRCTFPDATIVSSVAQHRLFSVKDSQTQKGLKYFV